MYVRTGESQREVCSVIANAVERGVVKFDGSIRHESLCLNWRNQAVLTTLRFFLAFFRVNK